MVAMIPLWIADTIMAICLVAFVLGAWKIISSGAGREVPTSSALTYALSLSILAVVDLLIGLVIVSIITTVGAVLWYIIVVQSRREALNSLGSIEVA